jgi:hypothetical protein
MATRVFTSVARNQPQQGQIGVNQVCLRVSASVTVSVGDTWVIGRLPHGAIPTDAVFYAAAQMVGKFGTSASLSLLFASATYSVAAARSTKRLGSAFQISVSDDVVARYENVTMVAGASDKSLGYFGDLVVSYVMPGQSW